MEPSSASAGGGSYPFERGLRERRTAAVVKALRKDADKGMAFGALALSTPAFVWAVYALAGGRF